MNKWILYLCCILPFCGWSEQASNVSKSSEIDKEIQVLNQRLDQIQVKEMKEEVESQGLMIADWDAYAKEVELIRKQEEEEKYIQMKIKELEERKAELLKQSKLH